VKTGDYTEGNQSPGAILGYNFVKYNLFDSNKPLNNLEA
jgi:hypothetical protein